MCSVFRGICNQICHQNKGKQAGHQGTQLPSQVKRRDSNMTQRYDGHPPMSKSQLQEYLESLRDDPSRGHSRTQSTDDTTHSRGSTPLVRALKERYGSTNSTPTYVDVGISKGKEVPTKRALPPVPAPKSSTSTGWRIKDQNQQEPRQPERQEEVPYSRVRSSSPTKRNDFWTTGVVRPLPSTPRTGSDWPLKPDPRDELQLDQLSLKDATSSRSPSIDVSNTNIPLIHAPSISVPSINVPLVKVPSSTSPEPVYDEPDKPTKSWPNVHVRSKSSPMLLCALCNTPIAGRIVTAVGSRFHPDCFRCTTCNTELVRSSKNCQKLTSGTCRLLRTRWKSILSFGLSRVIFSPL